MVTLGLSRASFFPRRYRVSQFNTGLAPMHAENFFKQAWEEHFGTEPGERVLELLFQAYTYVVHVRVFAALCGLLQLPHAIDFPGGEEIRSCVLAKCAPL